MPSIFCLDRNYEAVVEFINSMRHKNDQGIEAIQSRAQKRRRQRRWFDFGTMEEISPSAALVLAAEFDRARRILKRRMYAIDVEKWKPNVAQVLDHLGLFSLLEIDRPTGLKHDTDTRRLILPMRSGDQTVGSEIAALNHELAVMALEALGKPAEENSGAVTWRDRLVRVYLILTEAMDNVSDHAYRNVPDGFSHSIHRWWMTAAVDPDAKKLTVAIYDQGATIPATLPNWHNFDRMSRLWRRFFPAGYDVKDTTRDGLVLKAALKIAASSTDEVHRGKGLPIMADFLDTCRAGQMMIASRYGIVTKKRGEKAVAHRTSVPLHGTLVEWEVQF